MEFAETIQKVLEILHHDGKINNRDILALVQKDIDLYTKVREHLLTLDCIYDDKNIGLTFKGHSNDSLIKSNREKNEFSNSVEKLTDNDKIPNINQENAGFHIIFISYGRDDAQKFAKKLCSDLKHNQLIEDIWIDFEKIGVDRWDRKIEDGIERSTVFLALISPHAIRKQSICRDEVLYAFNVGKPIVPLLIQLKTGSKIPLLLCRRNWIDFSSEEKYSESFEKLQKFLSGDDSVLNPPALPIIVGKSPLDFAPEIARYSYDFTGREWIKKEIDAWIQHSSKRAFIIVGDPGVGKSAISAKLSQIYQDQVLGIHFCTRKNRRSLDPLELVANLIAQLNSQLSEYAVIIGSKSPEKPYTDAALAFRELIVEPTLKIVSTPPIPYLIIIDSLDEGFQQKGYSIVDLLFDQMLDLPPWIRIIATTRPEVEIIDKFGTGMVRFDLKNNNLQNITDIEKYLDLKFQQRNIEFLLQTDSPDLIDFRQKIVRRAGGNFLFIVLTLKAIEDGEISLNNPETFPLDLIDYFKLSFSRKYPDPVSYHCLKDVLQIILAAYEPLSSDQIGHFLKIAPLEVEKTLSDVSSFFPLIENKKYQPFHNSVIEWLKGEAGNDPAYRISISEGQKNIADTCWGEYQQGIGSMSQYCSSYLPMHLLDLERYQDLSELLKNPQFFIKIWEKNQFLIKSWWASIESVSPIRLTETYKDLIKHPGKYPINYVSYVANLLTDSGYPLSTEPIHNHFILYFRWRFDNVNLQTAYGNLGYTLLFKGELKKALSLFEKQEKICKKIQHKGGLMLALGNKGTALYKMNNLESALDCYKEQEKLCEELHNRFELQNCLGNQGNVFFDFEDFDQAELLYSRQKIICEEIDNLQGLCNVLGNEGNILLKNGDFEGAFDKYTSSEQLSRKILYTDGIQRSIGYQARLFYLQGQFDKALPLLEAQKEICIKTNNIRSLCESLRCKAQIFEGLYQIDHANSTYSEILDLYDKSGDKYGYLDAINCLGLLHYQNGEFNKARDYFKREEDLSKKENLQRNLQQAIIHKGIILEAQGNFKDAFKFYLEAEKISQSIGDQYGVQYALNNQAALSVMLGEMDKAIFLYNKTAEICKKTKNYYGLQYSLSSLGLLNENSGNYGKAIDLCEEHTNLCKKISKYYDEQRSLGILGSLYCKTGNFKSAEKCLEEQFVICINHEEIHEAVHSRIHLSVIKYNLGQISDAVILWKQAIELLDKANPKRWLFHALWNFGILVEQNRDIERLSTAILTPALMGKLKNQEFRSYDIYIQTVRESIDDLNSYYKECEQVCKNAGFIFGTQLFLAYRGLLRIIKGESQTALPLLLEYQKICTEIHHPIGQVLSSGYIAASYCLSGNLDNALKAMLIKENLCSEKKFLEGVFESRIEKAIILLFQDDPDGALKVLNESDRLFNQTPDFMIGCRASLLKGIIHELRNQNEKALHCFDDLVKKYSENQDLSGLQMIYRYQNFIKHKL
jgi:tetratricopeptide (TPR) repeat protein